MAEEGDAAVRRRQEDGRGPSSGLLPPVVPGLESASAAEPRRWAVAALMVWVGFNQGAIWMTFSASARELRELLPAASLPDAEIDLLLNWGPITYLVSVWAFMARMSRRGQQAVHEVVLWAAALILAGAVLRLGALLPIASPHLWLHAGQILNGFAGPVSAAVAPAFAAVWFPMEERTLATSLVWTCQSAAPSLGFAVALAAGSARGLLWILLAEAASATGACLLWALAVPPMPLSAPSASAAAQREATAACVDGGWSELRAALGRNRFWLLAISGGIAVGAFQVWSASLGVIFTSSALPGIGGAALGKVLGLVGNAGCFLGTMAAAPLAERFFKRRYKLFLVASGALQAALLAVFSASVPGAAAEGGSEPPRAALPVGPWGMLAVLSAASVLNGLTAPVCFELGAELTYPSPEGVSASAYSFTLNGGGFLVMLVLGGAALPGGLSCGLMAGLVVVSLALLLPVHETYPRLAVDAEGCRSLPGSPPSAPPSPSQAPLTAPPSALVGGQ